MDASARFQSGENVAAGAVLVRIDNPETIAKHKQALAAKIVAEAQLANINVGTQVYKRNVEPGEYISPGVPLVTLIDLNDLWVHFDLREDLVKTLKVGDRFDVRIPALADRRITVEVKLIATKGEYASWRATRATGDFDLRTFSIRAYPVEKVPELRPGMSAYMDWRQRG
jgi:HlyD family secretion protein